MVRKIRRKDEENDKDPFADWFNWRKERWFGFPGDIFDEFDEQFRKMERWMNYVFRDAMKGNLPSPEEGGPYVYGWSLRVGPDGKPHFEEFGNVPGSYGAPRPVAGVREPLVDVVEGDKTVSVTAEVPGVSKEDIDLEITENTVTISVDREDRRYYKEVELPCEVDTDSAKASYRNGILDIELKKTKPKRKGKKISVN